MGCDRDRDRKSEKTRGMRLYFTHQPPTIYHSRANNGEAAVACLTHNKWKRNNNTNIYVIAH